MIDYGKPLVTATHALEGDGPLVLDAYRHMQMVCTSFAQQHHPNPSAVARDLADVAGGITEPVLVQETVAKAQPAVTWFLRKFNIDLVTIVRAFKAARLFSPSLAQNMALDPQKVQHLDVFPFISDDDLQDLVEELPAYIAAIDGVRR
eukprot:scpid83936/ scgid11587/ 